MEIKVKKSFLVLFFILLFSVNLESITLTVLPFTTKNTNWVEEYSVDDGIPRMLEDMLNLTHRFNVTDYDLLISYFSSYDIVESYTSLSTNISLACNFTSESFSSDYLISGEVLKFDLEKGKVDTATVEVKINIIDAKTQDNIKTLTGEGKYTLPTNSIVYKSEDAFFNETALGRASIKALDILSKDIIKTFEYPPLTGVITRIENNKYYINIGSNNNIKIGDIFNIYSVEKVLELPTNFISQYSNNINTNYKNADSNYKTSNEMILVNSNYVEPVTNMSNDSIINTNSYFNDKDIGYRPVRSNSQGDIWYTSEMLYKYRHYVYKENIVTTARVIYTYENYSILEALDDKKVKLLMRVKLKEN